MLGCSETDPVDSPGELGRAWFHYECVEPEDHHCRQAEGQLPERIAVGGRFRLGTSSSDTSAQLVSPELVRVAYRNQFEFVRPGVAAFLATNPYDGTFFDFVHLLALPVTELRVQHETIEVTELHVAQSRAFSLSVVPYRDGEWLAGSLNAAWKSSDPRVVRTSERGTSVSLMAMSEGAAEVTVSFDDVSTAVNIVVGPPDSKPSPVPDGGSEDGGSEDGDGGALDGSTGSTSVDVVTEAGVDASIVDAAQINEAGADDGGLPVDLAPEAGSDGGLAPPSIDAGRDGGTL